MKKTIWKCQRYDPAELGWPEKCQNCKRWIGERCKDDRLLKELFEESKEFETFDRMMRSNRGICW